MKRTQMDLQPYTTKIVAAYLGHNPVPREQVPEVVAIVNKALGAVVHSVHRGYSAADDGSVHIALAAPAVPLSESVHDDYVTCLHCGHEGRTIKEHLMRVHGQSPQQYREHWGLALGHALTAPSTARRMSLSHGGHG